MREMQFRGGISELMKQANRMQRRVEETRDANKDRTVFATGANDKVKVTASLGRSLVRIEIDPELYESDRELALDAAVAAAHVALQQASEEMDKEIAKVTGGAKIPGIT